MNYKEIGDKIYVKHELLWHVAEHFLEMLDKYIYLKRDAQFAKGYKIMEKAVRKHISTLELGNITDMYVTIELEKWKPEDLQ